jgi:hypothetical protein
MPRIKNNQLSYSMLWGHIGGEFGDEYMICHFPSSFGDAKGQK